MNAWLPQASYPCGNFSDTSSVNIRLTKGSLGHAFTAYIHTENISQISICPYAPREISVLTELILGHLCYYLTDVPPQPNSPPDSVSGKDRHHLIKRTGSRQQREPLPFTRPRGDLALEIESWSSLSCQPNKCDNIRSSGISLALALPLILHLPSHHTMSD